MKSITFDEFLAFEPCWAETEAGMRRLKRYAAKRERWTALDILALGRVSAEDRLWAVLREELIDAPSLHEFACRCAERALSRVDKPDPRSVAAIAAKRAWLRGEIDDEQLRAARAAAYAAWCARDAAYAARAATCAAYRDACDAAWFAARYARDAYDAERKWNVAELQRMLQDAQA